MRITFKLAFGDEADEAYAWQFGGILERLLEAAGAKDVSVEMVEKSWEGAPYTVYDLSWR